MAKIALDAGHGLRTAGKQTPDGIKEWSLNDKVRDKVVEMLSEYDVEIMHTDNNEGDTDESLASRLAAYRNAKADVFVSIHHNAFTGNWNGATGVEVFVDNNATSEDMRLANCIYSRLPRYTGLRGRGVKRNNFYVINQNGIPAVLVEGGFMDGTEDYKVITSDAGQANYARAVAEGLVEFLGLKKKVVEPAPVEKNEGLKASDLEGLSQKNIVAKIGPLFTADQKKSGILASVSMAQFILESSYGKSELARNANNCFGMKKSLSGNTWAGSVWDGSVYAKETKEFTNGQYITITAEFRKYPSIEASVADHSAYLLGAMKGSVHRYEGLKGEPDYRKALQIIKDGGYATSPNYVDNLCNVVEKWNLTQYDLKQEAVQEEEKQTEDIVEIVDLPSVPFQVKVIVDDLNYRSQPSMSGSVKGQTGKGIFTIVEVSEGWGRLKSGVGWIWLGNPDYCTINGEAKKEEDECPFKVKVNVDNLNIRKGPSITNSRTGSFTGKGIFTIVEVRPGSGSTKGWGRLKSGAGWISLDYTEKV